jgi:cobaltochelatase CobT
MGSTGAAVRSTELRRDAEGVVRHGSEWLALWADPDSMRSAAARERDLLAARATARAERAVAATLRAMAERPALEVAFDRADSVLDGARARLPPLGRPPLPAALAVARGAADAISARLRHHDPTLHATLAPAAGEWRRLFDVLEQARCEALAARTLPGTLANLAAHSEARLERLGFAHARLPADLPLDEAMAVVLRGQLAERSADLPSLGLRLWDRWVRTRLHPHVAALAARLGDQPGYADAANEFIAALLRSIGRADIAPAPSAPAPAAERLDGEGDAPTHKPTVALPSPAPSDDEEGDTPPPAPAARIAAVAPRYAVFTAAHDRVVTPADLADAAELARLRARLDAETGGIRGLLSRLANQLQRRLLAQQRRAWDFDLEEGLLDAARLDRVVVQPDAPLSFKQERDAAFRDTVVSLLIDCSGSMRGRSMLLAGIAADFSVRALERCGVQSEILGFTTADFTGGQSAADWARAGAPKNPGRLGDLRHIVIKSADASYRGARVGMGVLLLPGLLRENVDGEALAWAHHRLLGRRERRRVLVVISDGVPAEAATLRANPPGLLERHLAETIAGIEAAGAVELRAIGIRHDVSRHYRRAVTISDAQMVGPALIAQLAAVFETPRKNVRDR